MTAYDDHDGYDDAAQDPQEGAGLPEGRHLWAVLGGSWGFIAEGQAGDAHHAWATMTAVMRLQPAHEEVYGLLRNGDTDRVARFERVRHGWYREVRA